MKLRRPIVHKMYAKTIDAFYADEWNIPKIGLFAVSPYNILPPKIQYKAYQDKVYPSDVVMDIIQWHDIIYDDVILHTKQRKY